MKNALLLTALLAVSATASAGFSENGQAAASQNAVTRVAALRSVPAEIDQEWRRTEVDVKSVTRIQ